MLDRQSQRLHAAFALGFPIAWSVLINMARPQTDRAVIPVVNTGERAVSSDRGIALLALEILCIHDNMPVFHFLSNSATFLAQTFPVA
jgi:hypothetical protein